MQEFRSPTLKRPSSPWLLRNLIVDFSKPSNTWRNNGARTIIAGAQQQFPETPQSLSSALLRIGSITVRAQRHTAPILGCRDIDSPDALLYADVVEHALKGTAHTLLEALMQSYQHHEFQGDFARKYVALGKAEGKVEDILRVLARRGLALSEEQRLTILVCSDLPTLDRWHDCAIVARSADELFA